MFELEEASDDVKKEIKNEYFRKKKNVFEYFSTSHAKFNKISLSKKCFFTVADNRQFAIMLTNLGELVSAINITWKRQRLSSQR